MIDSSVFTDDIIVQADGEVGPSLIGETVEGMLKREGYQR